MPNGPTAKDPSSDPPNSFVDVTKPPELHSLVLTLVFTDLADSVALKRQLGDSNAGKLIAEHASRLRALAFAAGGREIHSAGDGFFLTFEAPSSAVEFALRLQAAHRGSPEIPKVRIGIHMGEVTERRHGGSGSRVEIEGLAVDLASRIQSLSMPGQILLSYPVFENARQRLQTDDLEQGIAWRAHGSYRFKGIDTAVEMYEAGFIGYSPLVAPAASEKAHPDTGPDGEAILGWRPAQGLEIPARTNWQLVEQLGSGGFGDVWVAKHRKTHERRVFKFCFSQERLRTLKREVTLFRLLKQSLGDRPDIARVLDYQFEEPPYFLEMEYAGHGNLAEWADLHGGLKKIPLKTRLEVVARIADALAAAHGAGILHKDVKPSNILVLGSSDAQAVPAIRVIDFGIGALASRDAIDRKDITADGIAEVLSASQAGSVSGTQLYIAPEILEGKPATVWSDIYSLGVILYQMLVVDFTRALATGWERDVRDELLQKDIAACVDGNPGNRLTSARELAQRLRDLESRTQQRELRRHQEVAFEKAQRRHEHYRTAGLFALLLIAISVMMGMMQSYRAEDEQHLRKIAQAAHQDALLAKSRAEAAQHVAEEAQYNSAIGLAAASLREGRSEKVRDVLVNQTPEALRKIEWGLLYAQTSPETFALNRVNAFDSAFSPDGKLFATGDRDTKTTGTGWVTIYDARSGRRLRGAQIHDQLIWDLQFSPDGKTICTASSDKTGAIVNAESLEVIVRLKGHTAILRSASFSPDGKEVVTAARDGTLRIWDSSAGNELAQLQAPGDQLCEAFFSPSGKSIVSTALGGRVRQWDRQSTQLKSMFVGHAENVISACLGPKAENLITACRDGMVRIFPFSDNPATTESAAIRQFPTGNSWPQAIRYANGLNLILTACDDGRARLYDFQSGSLKLEVQSEEPAWKIEPSLDGNRALLTTRWSVRMLDLNQLLAQPEIVRTSAGTPLPDGTQRILANGSAAARDKTWKVDAQWRVPGGGRTLVKSRALNIAVESSFAVYSPGNDCRIVIDDSTLSASVVRNQDNTTITKLGDKAVCEAKFSRDGKLAATAGLETVTDLWDAKSWSLLRRLDRGHDFCCCEQFTTDGKQLAVGYADGDIIVWDCTTGAHVLDIAGSGFRPLCLAFSPDGRYLATGLASDRARVWDLKSGDQVTTLSGHVRYVHDICFSPDSSRILTVARDGTAKLWDFKSGTELLNVFDTALKTDLVTAFFCEDNQHLGAITSDGRLLSAEYFPSQPVSMPGLVSNTLFRRLELWKRQQRIGPDITLEDLETR